MTEGPSSCRYTVSSFVDSTNYPCQISSPTRRTSSGEVSPYFELTYTYVRWSVSRIWNVSSRGSVCSSWTWEVSSLWQTWHWLSWNSQMNQPITGRIGRSLQRSGICCLLGGFPAFLPYQQYSCRTQLARSQEGSLRSFVLSSLQSKGTQGPLHAKGFNCIVSRDQYVNFLTRNL